MSEAINSDGNNDIGIRDSTYLRSWEGSALMWGVSTECPNTAPSVPGGNTNLVISISKWTDASVFIDKIDIL